MVERIWMAYQHWWGMGQYQKKKQIEIHGFTLDQDHTQTPCADRDQGIA